MNPIKRITRWDVSIILLLLVVLIDGLYTGSINVFKVIYYQSSRPTAYWVVVSLYISLILSYVLWILFRKDLEKD